MGFVVPTVIAGFADCLRLWHILVQQTEVRAPRRPVVAARLLDAVSSWQTCKWWLTILALDIKVREYFTIMEKAPYFGYV